MTYVKIHPVQVVPHTPRIAPLDTQEKRSAWIASLRFDTAPSPRRTERPVVVPTEVPYDDPRMAAARARVFRR